MSIEEKYQQIEGYMSLEENLINQNRYSELFYAYILSVELIEEIIKEAYEIEDLNFLSEICMRAIDISVYVPNIGRLYNKQFFSKATSALDRLYKETRLEEYQATREALVKKYMDIKQILSSKKALDLNDIDMLNCNTVVLGYYDILQNDIGEFLFSINDTNTGDINDPVMYYDGKQHAIIQKNKNSIIVCDYINADIRQGLGACEYIYLYEQGKEDDDSLECIAPIIKQNGVEDIAEKIILQNKEN